MKTHTFWLLFLVFWGVAQLSLASESAIILTAENRSIIRGRNGTDDALYTDLVVFPEKLSFGDVLYLGLRSTNMTDSQIRVENLLFDELFRLKKCTFRSPSVNSVFVWEPPQFTRISPLEKADFVQGMKMYAGEYLKPDEESWSALETLELPTIQDWKHPFWLAMASLVKIGPQQIELELEYETFWDENTTYRTEITLRDCSQKNWKLLETWAKIPYEEYEMTPETRMNFLRQQLYPGVEAGGRHWSYSMIRGRLSKPSPEGLPKTASGWCYLEVELTGTLHDEVKFTRLFLDYINKRATTETEREMELQPMNEWLQKLPQVQRYAMLRQFSRAPDVNYTPPTPRYLFKEQMEIEKKTEVAYESFKTFYRFFVPFNPPAWEKRLKKLEEAENEELQMDYSDEETKTDENNPNNANNPDEKNLIIHRVDSQAGLRLQAEVYPCEIQLGDTIYFGVTVQNATGTEVTLRTIKDDDGDPETSDYWVTVDGEPAWRTSISRMQSCRNFRWFWDTYLNNFKCVTTIDTIPGANWIDCELLTPISGTEVENKKHYRNYIEFSPFEQRVHSDYWNLNPPQEYSLSADERIACIVDSAEFPSLEDWDQPFWRNLRENMPAEGVDIRLRFCFPHPWSRDEEIPVETVVRVKPRCAKETEQITDWYQSTPKAFFPEVQFSLKSWLQGVQEETGHWKRKWVLIGLSEEDLPETWKYPISLPNADGSETAYNPWFFMRVGNRKPFGDGVPRDLKAWRTLEESWTPGTLRDEMKMTRLIIDAHEKIAVSSLPENVSTRKFRTEPEYRTELDAIFASTYEWLETLPKIQQYVLLKSIFTRFNGPSRTRFAFIIRDYTPSPNAWQQREKTELKE
ncbi:MAG: hypothetical protein Q4C70_04425 [Planctomycetia bacterium]|nr:hypothetical protein [Planctomycetia bacterium]